MSSVDYMDLKHLDTVETVDGYQLEKYRDTVKDSYALLLRKQRFGTVKEEVTVSNERDADQLLEAGRSTDMKEVLEEL